MPTFPSISYDSARRIKEKQDEYCLRALRGQWKNLGEFPEDLKWEALVDVLRGRVKVFPCKLLPGRNLPEILGPQPLL